MQTNKRTLLAKTETTYGVDPTPTGSANAVLVKNLDVKPINATTVPRDLVRPFFGNSDTLLAETNVVFDFEIELQGSGTPGVAPAWGPILEACGFVKTIVATTSVTYHPISDNLPSMTMYFNNDGVLHKATGCRGTAQFGLNVKQIPTIKFTFTGIFNSPSDTARPSVDYSAYQTPRVVNTHNTSSFSLFGYSAPLESMDLNLSNDVQYRTLVGSESVILADRKVAGTFVIEAPTITAKDYFTLAQNGTTGAMTITHGVDAGDIITLSAPRISIQSPTYTDGQGIQMLSIPFVAAPITGNDEVVIALT